MDPLDDHGKLGKRLEPFDDTVVYYGVTIPPVGLFQIPDNGLNRLSDRILLFRHDYCSPNVLQLVNAASDVTDETLLEIVLTANR